MPTLWNTPDVWHNLPQVIAHLKAGHLLGLPTETVYGLAADALQQEAVYRIFEAKERPFDHPLIAHISTPTLSVTEANQRFSASQWTKQVIDLVEAPSQQALALMSAFWPGPLTLIMRRREGVATQAAGGHETIGVRCPRHPVAQAVLQAAWQAGIVALAAPSANRFGRISPTTAEHVLQEFAHLPKDALWVLEGGACEVGIESTIVDVSQATPAVLRYGMITPLAIEAVLGQVLASSVIHRPRHSGDMLSHYAPVKPLRLWLDAQSLLSAWHGSSVTEKAITAIYAPQNTLDQLRSLNDEQPSLSKRWQAMPLDSVLTARQLFSVLRQMDAISSTQRIWVQAPPADHEWLGVLDRLKRASS